MRSELKCAAASLMWLMASIGGAAAAGAADATAGLDQDRTAQTERSATPTASSPIRIAQQDAYSPGGSYGSGSQYGTRSQYGAPSQYDAPSGSGSRYTTTRTDDAYRPPASGGYDDAYRSSQSDGGYGSGSAYNSGPPPSGGYDDAYRGRSAPPSGSYGEPYAPPPGATARHDGGDGYPEPRGTGPGDDRYDDRKYYSKNEIIEAGHGFFGSISKGLASVIEHAFKKAGRPNGYILGEDAGGAFVAGLRYGEGRLHTKDAGTHKVYWQGPSVGYDFGGAGAKTMILVYNLRDPSDIFHRFGGVEGSAYLVGGVSIQFQKHGDVVMAPIRAGIGLRLGANVGYLKYTRRPTWNPF